MSAEAERLQQQYRQFATLDELIERLEAIREELGTGDVPAALAIQPTWAFEHSIDLSEIQAVNLLAPDEEALDFASMDGEERKMAQAAHSLQEFNVVYIAEKKQEQYLPGIASKQLGWK
jgi:hypothetical protein